MKSPRPTTAYVMNCSHTPPTGKERLTPAWSRRASRDLTNDTGPVCCSGSRGVLCQHRARLMPLPLGPPAQGTRIIEERTTNETGNEIQKRESTFIFRVW